MCLSTSIFRIHTGVNVYVYTYKRVLAVIDAFTFQILIDNRKLTACYGRVISFAFHTETTSIKIVT